MNRKGACHCEPPQGVKQSLKARLLRCARNDVLTCVLTCVLMFLCSYVLTYAQSTDNDDAFELEVTTQADMQMQGQLKNYFTKYYMKQAKALLRAGKTEEALVKFRRILKWDGESSSAKEGITAAEKKIAERFLSEQVAMFAPTGIKADERIHSNTPYHLSADDTLEITVGGKSELSRELSVRQDGTIFYPLIGNIKVLGLTLSQVEQEITKGLSAYINDPQVAVTVKVSAQR